jgi:hypothetical protein
MCIVALQESWLYTYCYNQNVYVLIFVCVCVFAMLCRMYNINITHIFVIAGTHVQIENHIRTFFRRVVLDHCQSVVDRAFWLGRILKPWPMVHQARFLFMLYGPEYNGNVNNNVSNFKFCLDFGNWTIQWNSFLAHLSWKLKWAFLITFCPSSFCLSVWRLLHFQLLLQNRWVNFNQSWHKSSLAS